jgi:predicted transcriptional regulator
MMSFDLFVKSIQKSSIANDERSFEEQKGVLAELKNNGFDVQYFEDLLDKVTKVKFEHTKHLEEKPAVEAQKLRAISSLSRNESLLDEVDQDMAELEQKLDHLRQKGQLIEKDKEDDEERLSKLSMVESRVQKDLDADKQQFQSVLAGMLQKQLT